jgi:LacI family transcriptional regulator
MGMKSNRTTIREVARAAGVSIQTVSRVINNRPDVSKETRQRICELIEEMRFQPNAVARSLIQQRSFTLGVVTAGLKYAGVARSLNGITAKAEEIGYSLLLEELPDFATTDVLPVIEGFLARQVDGLIWAVPEVSENRSWISEIDVLPFPVAFLTMRPEPGVSVVSVDNYRGAVLATQHLIQREHTRIGHIAGPQDWWESQQRFEGWRQTLTLAGLPAEERQFVEGNWSSASGEAAMEKLYDQFPEMDAIFVANDQMALAVLQFAARHGIQIPRQLAVVGFDGLPESEYYWPSLTTIFQDQQMVGNKAVELLAQQIDCMDTQNPVINPAQIYIQPSLIVRDSS